MDVIKEIERFQTDRDLHLKEYDGLNEATSIIEELLEAEGLDVTKANRAKLTQKYLGFTIDCEVYGVADRVARFKDVLEHEKVDAYCDIIVFAVGAIMKLGFDPELSLQEVAKEINSREGSMVGGKFEKDLSPEAVAKHYKADYTLAVK